MIKASFAYVRSAVKPALVGTIMFALTSMVGDYIRDHEVFGMFSIWVSAGLIVVTGVAWFAMALREGLGEENPKFGLRFGRQEWALARSMAGFVFVMALIGLMVGFLVFLLIMMVAAVGGGALSGDDAISAPIFESPEAFQAFLTGTHTGQIIGGIGVIIAGLAALFLFWLMLRLSPFAAGAVVQKRFVVLQAMVWTRYKDRALFTSGLPTIGLALALIFIGRHLLLGLPIMLLISKLLAHLLTCFCLLIIVGFICTAYEQFVRG